MRRTALGITYLDTLNRPSEYSFSFCIPEVYIYDTANRLKEIREQTNSGKILKEFKYNYKQ